MKESFEFRYSRTRLHIIERHLSPIRSQMKPLTGNPPFACYSISRQLIGAVVHVRGRQGVGPYNFSGEVSPRIPIVTTRLLRTSFNFLVNSLNWLYGDD